MVEIKLRILYLGIILSLVGFGLKQIVARRKLASLPVFYTQVDRNQTINQRSIQIALTPPLSLIG